MPIDPVSPVVQAHLDALVPERPSELQEMEAWGRENRFPIIGPSAGFFCYQLARLAGARTVYELGSGYGYSTAWFARAVVGNGGGTVDHVVWDEDLSARARRHLAALGYDGVVRYHVGEAVAALRETDGPFDLIFNDIDKHGYPGALEVVETKLRPGGLLIADNMFLHGRIFDEDDDNPSVEGIREFTRRLADSDRWDLSIVPIRDGLAVATFRG